MTLCRWTFSNCFLESWRLVFGPGRVHRNSASEDVSKNSALELDDGEDGEPGDSPESDDEEEIVPLDGFDSFAADMLAFSAAEVKRANLISIRILRNALRRLGVRTPCSSHL